jgi:hypothetical protein
MKTMGNILIMPGPVAREKKVSAFKTISFLVSSSENEPGTNCPDHICGDEGDHAHVPDPQEDRYAMGGFEEDNGPQENPAFLHEGDNFPRGLCTVDGTFMKISCLSAGEKTLPASSLQGNSCRDIPPEKNDVVYPGRSVLYSRQFRPLNRIISSEYKTPPVR